MKSERRYSKTCPYFDCYIECGLVKKIRKQTLEEALKEDRMLRDIDDSIKAWKAIGKKEPLTETDDSGDTRDYLIVAVITIVILAVIAFIALVGGVQLV